jgi:hypothetical protein
MEDDEDGGWMLTSVAYMEMDWNVQGNSIFIGHFISPA